MFTYRDAIEYLIDVMNLDGKDVAETSRKLRRAVKEACNRVPAMHDWEFQRLTGMISTTAPYTTGTIEYTASTKTITLTGGVWPSDAQFGDLIIDRKRFMCKRRVSDTVLILDDYQSPVANIAAGTYYQWMRNRYTLPYFVGDILEVTDIQLLSLIRKIQVEDNFWFSEAWNVTGSPSAWSMMPSRHLPGQWEFWLSSVPNDVRYYRYLYSVRWATNIVEQLNTGTVSITGDVATFSSAILTPDCLGCVLRVSSSSSVPTSDIGRYDTTTKASVLNPPASEHIITSITSTSVCTLNAAPTSNVSTKGFTISSQIPLNTEGMLQFFFRLLDYQYNVLSRADQKVISYSENVMLESFKLAMAADARRIESGRAKIIDPRPIIRE